ncbi:MAG: hypothetical protein AAGA32_08310 [Pseudomonadota bacterium]
MESVFSSSKNKSVQRIWVQIRREAKAALFASIEIVSNRQRHSGASHRPPAQAHPDMEPETAA